MVQFKFLISQPANNICTFKTLTVYFINCVSILPAYTGYTVRQVQVIFTEKSLHKKLCNITVYAQFQTVPDLQNYSKTSLQSELYSDFSPKLS